MIESAATDGTLIFYDFPECFLLGIDFVTFEISSDVRGIAGIPKGMHLIFFESEISLRKVIYFEITEDSDIFLVHWNFKDDCILMQRTTTIDQNELMKIKYSMLSYPIDRFIEWKGLTNFISSQLLLNIGIKLLVPFSNDCSSSYLHDITEVQRKIFESIFPNKTPTEITSMHLDHTWFLNHLLNQFQCCSMELLGKFQFSFICSTFLLDFSALGFWQRMLTIFCNSKTFLESNESFTKSLIMILFYQVSRIDPDFFLHEKDSEFYLLPSFRSLFFTLQDIKNREIHSLANRLICLFEKRLDLIHLQDDEDFQFEVNLEEEYESDSLHVTAQDTLPREDILYSWRYPLLFEEKIRSPLNEDLLMTAMRILDESEDEKIRQEATAFVLHETKFLQYSESY